MNTHISPISEKRIIQEENIIEYDKLGKLVEKSMNMDCNTFPTQIDTSYLNQRRED